MGGGGRGCEIELHLRLSIQDVKRKKAMVIKIFNTS